MKDFLLSDFEKFILPNNEKIVGGLQWSCTTVYNNANGSTLTLYAWGDYSKGTVYNDRCSD